MSLRFRYILTFLMTMMPFCATFAQNDFISSLKKNLGNYNPQYIDAKVESIAISEHLFPKVLISNESYTLTQNAISYYDAISSLPVETKTAMQKAHSEIAFAAGKSGLISFPDELLWLPFAISAFDKHYEQDGNCGIWGLQYLYAIKYGVEISECTDGRQDIMQSTKAAIRQLQYFHEKFEKWDIALAAYLFGPSNLKLMQVQGKQTSEIYTSLDPYGKNIFDIWCAVISWMENYRNSKIEIKEIEQQYDTIHICDRIHIEQISKVMDISINELKSLNATFSCEVIDGRRIPVTYRLPAGRKNDFATLHDSIVKYKDTIYFPPPKAPAEPKNYVVEGNGEKIIYKIQQGDYLGKIAQKFGVKVSDIQAWNGLSGTNISAGKTLVIWTGKKPAQSSQTTQPKTNTATPKSTTQSNTSTSTTTTFNAKDYTLVETYTVKSGDNPYNIAKRYSWATADEILKWNNISDPSKLQIGQKLKIYRKK
ncbi:MAG: LysM peptidoglycan-binding domain-containing protein [Bacteroidales bacterium]|nr:LysM peptidoglycan-binding domain-containing protein [Bacteroidales bacterium]